jgi:hypothetical protein
MVIKMTTTIKIFGFYDYSFISSKCIKIFINSYPLKYTMDRPKMIPKDGDLEFRVKKLRRRDSVVNLDESESALYVGSGENLQKANHMLDLVDAPHYILSDFEFEGKRRLSKCVASSKNTSKPQKIQKLLIIQHQIYFIWEKY